MKPAGALAAGTWLAIAGMACEPVHGGTRASDAGPHPASPKHDAAAGPCAAWDAPCITGGYAHFKIPNVSGSGLPNEPSYETTELLLLDRVSQLTWQRFGSEQSMGWDEARRYCEDLEVEGVLDFRLPMRIELVTLLDFAQSPVVVRGLGEVNADYHWSSSPATISGSAYSVYFGAGETTIANASPGRAFGLCVSGTPRGQEAQFELSESVAEDAATGLVWQRKSQVSTFDEAEAICARQSMRLPSVRELQSIVDERSNDPAIDTNAFPETIPSEYWTSSTRGEERWTVDFTDGKTYARNTGSEILPSRCTR